jgi:hyperosmotically inducible protein
VFDNFTYKVDGSTVTLAGKVTRPTLKKSAERVVERIEGVDKVVNQIDVLPVSSNDDRIRIGTFRAIYYNPMFSRMAIQAVPPIHIIVENGDVTLEGAVNTNQEKTVAGIQANGVSGVFSVTNNLQVVRD